jgi:hypothetical protein
MKWIFQNRWFASLIASAGAGLVSLLVTGQIDLMILLVVFAIAALAFSYPSLAERIWQSRNLPPDALNVNVHQLRTASGFDLLKIFDLPAVYLPVQNRYTLKTTDPEAPGLFLYIYLPSWLYELRNIGPDAVYRHLSAKLKSDSKDPESFDLIAQRNLPLAFGFRFIPKNEFSYHANSKIINVVKKEYFRENTRIRGVLQSRKRLFRLHSPEDNEWRTFLPYLEESQLLYGGVSLSHDFRSNPVRHLPLRQVRDIDAEVVEYPEKIPFGSLLTYAKKGEIALESATDAVDRLYIDRINVLMNGTEKRREILDLLKSKLNRDFQQEDIYPLFNYGQKLRGYLESGSSISDSVSSRGNFAIYYDNERGWTIVNLETKLVLQLQEDYWSRQPAPVNGSTSLSTSRATLITGAPDRLLRFRISTGTPTRGQVFAADEMIEGKIKEFSAEHRYQLVRPVGSGAEGCLYLAKQNGRQFYLKSPDGQLAAEEISTIRSLQEKQLIPKEIETYAETRMIVLPEYSSLPENLNGNKEILLLLLFRYLKNVWEAGYLCLDLTPDHVKLAPEQNKLFLIDFAGYVSRSSFEKDPHSFLTDRKKIEYRVPEENGSGKTVQFSAEAIQLYLAGLLFYQLLHSERNLPRAVKVLDQGHETYQKQIAEDLSFIPEKWRTLLATILSYDPPSRQTFDAASAVIPATGSEGEFWNEVRA